MTKALQPYEKKGFVMIVKILDKPEFIPISQEAKMQICDAINRGQKIINLNNRALREYTILDIRPDDLLDKYIEENDKTLNSEERKLALKINDWGERVERSLDGESIIKKYGYDATLRAYKKGWEGYDGKQAMDFFWDSLKSSNRRV